MSSTKFNIKILFQFSLFLYLILYTYCQNINCVNNCISNRFTCSNKGDLICSQKCRPKYGDGTSPCYYCDFENNYYYIDSGGECKSGCNEVYILDWSKECVSTSTSTLTGLYKMEDVYYKTCPIYSTVINENECKCENKYYKEILYGKTIIHCLSSVSDCPNFKRFHNSNSKECIESCTDPYLYSANNICYQLSECIFYKEISTTDLRCLSTCDVGEGFVDASQPKKCLSSCSGTNSYYNHGENKCMASCSASNNNKIYRKPEGKECFSSCKDIDGGQFIYSQKDSSTSDDYLCYSTVPSGCSYYFPLNNGVKKCVEIADCQNSNHIYLKGNECIEECDF